MSKWGSVARELQRSEWREDGRDEWGKHPASIARKVVVGTGAIQAPQTGFRSRTGRFPPPVDSLQLSASLYSRTAAPEILGFVELRRDDELTRPVDESPLAALYEPVLACGP